MIPSQFEYVRATSLEHAGELLELFDGEAKVLAGGQSLIPLLRLRFPAPAAVIDIGALDELRHIGRSGDTLRIGALSRHRDVADSEVIRNSLPLLSEVASRIGDPQVRNRGTIGGSLAHADPAGDYAATCLMLDAELVTNRRTVPARAFFKGVFTTALEPGELLTEIVFPAVGRVYGYVKFGERLADWAIVGVSAQEIESGWRIGLTNVGSVPVRAEAVETALAQGATALEAADLASEGLDPPDTLHASAAFKRHLARVLTRRAVDIAARRR